MDGRLNPEPLNYDKQPNIKQVYRKHCANINILRSPLLYKKPQISYYSKTKNHSNFRSSIIVYTLQVLIQTIFYF